MPRLRTTIILLLACVACGALLRILHQAAPGRTHGLGESGMLLFPAPLRGVNRLVVEQSGKRIELQRNATGWQMLRPREAPANQQAVQRLLDLLEAAPLRGRITRHEMELRELTPADFGLLQPQATILVAGPGYRSELWLGTATSASNEFFCAFASGNEVLLTDRTIHDGLPRSPLALGDARFFREDTRRIGALGIRRTGQPYIKLAQGTSGWSLTQPLVSRADAAAVAELLTELTTVRIEQYLWPTARTAIGDRDEGGLPSEGLELQIWLAGDPVARHIVLQGDAAGIPGCITAIPPEGGGVVVISNALLQVAQRPLETWRDKRIWTLNESEVTALSVRGWETPWAMQRTAAGLWEMTAPVTEIAERGAAEELLNTLLSLQATAFGSVPPLPNSGDHEYARLEVVTAAGSQRLLLYDEPTTSNNLIRLAFEGDTTAWLVARSAWLEVAEQLRSPLSLRNRTILRMPAEALRRITVRRAAATNRLEIIQREMGGNQWRAVGAEHNVNAGGVDLWLETLAELRAERVETLAPFAAAAPYGLEPPWLEVTLDLTAEESLRRILLVGKLTGEGRRFAAVKGHDTIYLLAPEVWQRFERSLWQSEGEPTAPGLEPELVAPQPLEKL